MIRQVEKPKPPDLDANLEKLKHKPSLLGSWTNRYFRVNPKNDTVEYFPNKSAADNGKPPSGYFALANLKAVKKFDENSFQIDVGKDGVYLLRTESKSLLAYWIDELENYIKCLREYERYEMSLEVDKEEAKTRK